MINKTKIKTSNYAVLDSDPSTIAKNIAKGVTTIENLNKQVNQENQEPENSNNVVVRTVQDNLVHNYFHYFDLYWDAGDVMSSAVIKLPKTDTGNTQYWITYTGEVDIYIGASIDKDVKTQTNANNTNTSTEYWNMQGMKPLFRGEVGQIKEYTDVLEIHIDSIGKRFKQKIPDEFRQSFINNQNVRDAFQAICEFLGVKYICPPPTTPPEDEEMATDSTTTDGTENNVTDKTQAEQNMASRAKTVASQMNSSVKSSVNNGSNASGNTNSDDTSESTDTTNQALTATETDSPQNGYGDISFDANGAIIHGSTVIETSPDMAETLIAMTEHPLQKYTEDMTYVAADVKKLLTGEFFDTVNTLVMNYDAITITPKSSSTSNMSTVGGTSGDASSGSGNANNISGNAQGSHNGSSGSSGGRNGWSNGQLYSGGKIVLSKEYIRTLPPSQAGEKYRTGKNTYTSDTLQKLLWRSMGSMLL